MNNLLDQMHTYLLRRLWRGVNLLAAVIGVIIFLSLNATAAGAGVIMFAADSRYDLGEFREIHLMRPNGNDDRKILPDYRMKAATISPKGDKVAYLTQYGNALRIVNIDGKNEKQLAILGGTTSNLAWSPNGRYIAITFQTANGLSVSNKVGYYDVRKKKVIGTRTITSQIGISYGLTSLNELDWSPDGRHLFIHETGFATFGGISTPANFSHVIKISNTRVLVDKQPASGWGFFDNNKILLPVSFSNGPFVIATQNIFNKKRKKLINLGSPLLINEIRTKIPGRTLLVQIERFPQTYAAGETDIRRVRGKSRWEELGFDLLEVDVKTKTATYITPKNESFVATNHGTGSIDNDGIAMQYRKRTPARTFKTDHCWGWVITIKGTPGDDRINGTRRSDVIHGLAGDDVIKGGAEDDVLCGGHGNDTLIGGTQNDVLAGDRLMNRIDVSGNGNDKLVGGKGDDLLSGGDGNDRLRGGPDDDLLFGNAGNDIVDGQTGTRDRVNGGDGVDRCSNYATASECE